MKNVTKMAAQGDCLFIKRKELPKETKELKHSGPIVVAHSETGHHHAVDSMHVKAYEVPGNSLVMLSTTVLGIHMRLCAF
jgi:hypothetical protein